VKNWDAKIQPLLEVSEILAHSCPQYFKNNLKTSKLPEILSNQENEEYTDLLILSIYFTDHSILSG
jgi:hypothetical protein